MMNPFHRRRLGASTAFWLAAALQLGAAVAGCAPGASPTAIKPAPTPANVSEQASEPPLWEFAVERLWEAGDDDGIIAICDRVLADEPRNTSALVWRAYGRLQAEEMEKCSADIDAALAIDPKCADAWAAKGAAELAANSDHPAARKLYDRAIEIDPGCELAWRARARSFAAEEEYEQAVADYTKLIELLGEHSDYSERGAAYQYLEQHEAAIRDFDAAIRLKSDEQAYFGQRGYSWGRLKQYDKAIADVDKALELEPEHPAGYSYRASYRVHQGDFDGAIADWLTAIDRTPDDAGKNYQALSATPPPDEALRHGEEQLRAILRDRPEMAEFVKPGDRLWTWAVRKLAGEDVGEPVYWNPRTLHHAPACHRRPSEDSVGSIQIASDPQVRGDGESTAFERCWQGLVFELHNMTFAAEFECVNKEGETGALSKHDYIRATSDIETRADQLRSAFYAHVFLPWAKESGFTQTNPYGWMPTSLDIEAQAAAHGQEVNYYGFYADGYEVYFAEEECRAGKHAEALKRLEAILSRPTALEDDGLAEAYYWLGHAQLALGQEGKSLESFKHAVALNDEWLGEFVFRLKGRLFFGKNVESETTQTAGAHFLRGYSWGNLGNIEKSMSDLDAAIEIDPNYAEARFQRATAFHLRNEIEPCIAELEKVVETNPDFVPAYALRGTIWMEKKDAAKALADLDENVRLNPENPDALLFRAQAYARFDEVDKALADLDAALTIDKAYEPGWVLRGMVHCQRGEFAAGIADFEQALKLNPQASHVFNARALMWSRRRDYAKALADLEQQLALTPEEAWAWAQKGEALVGLGEYDQALVAAEAAIGFDPSVYLGYMVRAKVRSARSEFAAALADFDKAIEVLPDAQFAFIYRAEFLRECEDPSLRNVERAVQDATHACELTNWKDRECLAALAACHAEAGDFANAVEWQTKAVEAAPGDWKAMYEGDLELFRSGMTLRQREGVEEAPVKN